MIFGLVVAIAVVSFGVKNMTPASIQYFGVDSFTAPLFFLLVGAFALGFFASWSLGFLRNVRLRRYLRKGQARAKKLEERIQELEAKTPVPTLSKEEEGKHSPPT